MLWQDESNLVPYKALMLWGFIYFIFFFKWLPSMLSLSALLIEIFLYAEMCQDVIRVNHLIVLSLTRSILKKQYL